MIQANTSVIPGKPWISIAVTIPKEINPVSDAVNRSDACKQIYSSCPKSEYVVESCHHCPFGTIVDIKERGITTLQCTQNGSTKTIWNKVQLNGYSMANAMFHNRYMAGGLFSAVDFSNSNLSHCNMRNIDFISCEFNDTIFSNHTYLIGCNFYRNYKADIHFSHSVLSGVKFATSLPGSRLTFSRTKFLDDVVLPDNCEIMFSEFPSIQDFMGLRLHINSKELITELMCWDMELHPRPESFLDWARLGSGYCPYKHSVIPAFNFNVDRELFVNRKPEMIWPELCTAICEDQGWVIDDRYLE
jgi:Pentapeptide repeats (8 copies)